MEYVIVFIYCAGISALIYMTADIVFSIRKQELEIVESALAGLKQSVISNHGNLIRIDLSRSRFAVISPEKKTVAIVVLEHNTDLSKRQEKHAYKLIQNEIQERLEQNAYR